MTPARVDLFGPIHKGLRALLFASSGAVARADVTRDVDMRGVIELAQRLIGFLREHSLHEDMRLLPLVAAEDPTLGRALAQRHAELEALQNQLGALLARADGSDAPERLRLAPGLSSIINRLTAAHLVHMDDEERAANALLWRRCSDEHLAVVQAQIIQSMTPERSLEWMQLVLPALNPGERVALTAGFVAGAPPELAARLVMLARQLPAEMV
jgi:hypothetical protein